MSPICSCHTTIPSVWLTFANGWHSSRCHICEQMSSMLSVSPMLTGVTYFGRCHSCWQVSPMLTGVTRVSRCHPCRQVSPMSSSVTHVVSCNLCWQVLITDRCPNANRNLIADRHCNYCYVASNILTGVTLGGYHTESGKLIIRWLSETVAMGTFLRKIICLCSWNRTIKICCFSILQAFDVRTSG